MNANMNAFDMTHIGFTLKNKKAGGSRGGVVRAGTPYAEAYSPQHGLVQVPSQVTFATLSPTSLPLQSLSFVNKDHSGLRKIKRRGAVVRAGTLYFNFCSRLLLSDPHLTYSH